MLGELMYVNGDVSRWLISAEANSKPVGFAVAGESEDCVPSQRTEGVVKSARGEKVFRSVGDVDLWDHREQPQRKL